MCESRDSDGTRNAAIFPRLRADGGNSYPIDGTAHDKLRAALEAAGPTYTPVH